MSNSIRISIAVACALGVSAAMAQTVQRGSGTSAAPAQVRAPVQVAQAGGAAAGASTAGAVGGVGAAGTVASTIVFVGAAVASVAGASGGNGATVTHTP